MNSKKSYFDAFSKSFAALAVAYIPTIFPVLGWLLSGKAGVPTNELISPFWFVGSLLAWYVLKRKENIDIKLEQQPMIVYFFAFVMGFSINQIYCYMKDLFDPVYLSFESGTLYVNFVVIVILGPITEEIIFRGLFLEIFSSQKINNKFMCLVAICLSTFVWALLHNRGTVDGVIRLIIDGLILCVLYLIYKNLFLCILFHSGFNASIFVLASLNKEHWIYNVDNAYVDFRLDGEITDITFDNGSDDGKYTYSNSIGVDVTIDNGEEDYDILYYTIIYTSDSDFSMMISSGISSLRDRIDSSYSEVVYQGAAVNNDGTFTFTYDTGNPDEKLKDGKYTIYVHDTPTFSEEFNVFSIHTDVENRLDFIS